MCIKIKFQTFNIRIVYATNCEVEDILDNGSNVMSFL